MSSAVELRDGASVSGNTATKNGGGVFVQESTLTVLNSASVSANTAGGCISYAWADSAGGNCEAYDANPEWCGYEESMDKCCACGGGQMTASHGGGVYLFESTLTAAGAAINSNEALDVGGGVFAYTGAVVLSDSSSISNNMAHDDGGGV